MLYKINDLLEDKDMNKEMDKERIRNRIRRFIVLIQ